MTWNICNFILGLEFKVEHASYYFKFELASDIGVLWKCERAFINLYVFVLFKSSIGSGLNHNSYKKLLSN